MLVRRIATVTICAPEASIAARVCAKSLYLPVPTSSRDVKDLPAIWSTSFISTPTHRDHDFQPVAVGEQGGAVGPARHDFAVALDGNLPAGQGEALKQRRNRHRAFKPLCGTVHGNLDHGRN